MKKIFFKASLSSICFLCSGLMAAEPTTCQETCTLKDSFDVALNQHRRASKVKDVYKGFLKRLAKAAKDKDVVAARAEVYDALLRLKNKVQEKIELTPEESEQLSLLMKMYSSIAYDDDEGLTEEFLAQAEASFSAMNEAVVESLEEERIELEAFFKSEIDSVFNR